MTRGTLRETGKSSSNRTTELAHRVFYLATFAEGVYVLHAFEKRTRKTPPHDVKLARDRYRALLKKRADDAKKK